MTNALVLTSNNMYTYLTRSSLFLRNLINLHETNF